MKNRTIDMFRLVGQRTTWQFQSPVMLWNGSEVTKPFEWPGDKAGQNFVPVGRDGDEMTAWWESVSRGV
jgi:hypothetical protein